MLVAEFESLGKTCREIAAVGNDDKYRVRKGVNLEQHAGHDFSRFLIEIAGGFVAEQQSRFHDECARERDALFFAA